VITALPGTFEEGYRSVHDTPQMALGEHWHSNDLAIDTSYVRFAEDVKLGDAVRTKYGLYAKSNISPKTSGGSDYPAAKSTTIEENDATYLTSLAGVPPQPEYRDFAEIAITGGTGVGQHGIIQDYSNKLLNILWYSDDSSTKGAYTDGLLTTALGSDTDYVVTAPWYVEKCDGPGIVNGIVLANAKKDQYGLILRRGTYLVKVGEAVTAGQRLYVDSENTDTDSEGEGFVPAFRTNSVSNLQADIVSKLLVGHYATALHAGAANALVRAYIACTPISIVPELPRAQARAFPRPRTSIAA